MWALQRCYPWIEAFQHNLRIGVHKTKSCQDNCINRLRLFRNKGVGDERTKRMANERYGFRGSQVRSVLSASDEGDELAENIDLDKCLVDEARYSGGDVSLQSYEVRGRGVNVCLLCRFPNSESIIEEHGVSSFGGILHEVVLVGIDL